MYQKGDWVTIKYGEYAGCSGRISGENRDGTLRVIPYRRSGEPGSMLMLDENSMQLLEPEWISHDELLKLVRAQIIYRDIADRVFPIFHIKARESCEMTADDIVCALKNINEHPDCLERFREWFWLIQNILYEDLKIGERYHPEAFSDAPESEDELFSTVYYLTENLYWKLEERYAAKENTARYIVRFEDDEPFPDEHSALEEKAYKAVCEDIASRVRTFGINHEKPRKEWVYSPSQKRHFINSYDSEEALSKASAADRALYRRCVMDLFRLGDTQAMKILAWGYMEGGPVFRQSFRQAEKYLLCLYRKTGDSFAANSLGYLYYYGLVGKKEPDYGKAFQYFSISALAGIDESLYTLGEMLIHGKGTVKNIDVGINLIVDGYRDTLQRFCYGEFDNRFADYAYHMGRICLEDIVLGMGLRDACKFLLEAEYAIGKRLEGRGFFGDELLRDRIREELASARKSFVTDPQRSVLKADFPIYISHIFEDRFPIQVSITQKQSVYYLKMKRIRLVPGTEPGLLVAFPELSYVDFVSELTFRLEGVGVVRIPDSGETFLAEGFAKNEHTGALEFYAGGECVAAVEAQWFVIDVTRQKILKKLNKRKRDAGGKEKKETS